VNFKIWVLTTLFACTIYTAVTQTTVKDAIKYAESYAVHTLINNVLHLEGGRLFGKTIIWENTGDFRKINE
jgi:hypothetical protein